MAKIIDFKTKQILADLPYKLTAKRVRHWGIKCEGELSNVIVVATEEIYAVQILKQIEEAMQPKAEKAS